MWSLAIMSAAACCSYPFKDISKEQCTTHVHYGVKLVHEGDVVTVEGKIMHEPKASALSARDRYYIARVH